MRGSWRRAGCEALFVGTGGVVGAYTGLADVGTATMTECVADRRLDRRQRVDPGDHGRRYRPWRHHGGAPAWCATCIRAGIAGIRIDDQPIEGKRKTQSAGVEVVPLRPGDRALPRRGRHEERARPEFRRDGAVLCARCREWRARRRDARLKAYREEAGVDWVQLESPHSVDEIKAARAVGRGPVLVHEGQARPLSRPRRASGARRHDRLVSGLHPSRHLGGAVGLHGRRSSERGVAAWDEFVESREDRPYPIPEMPDGRRRRRQAARARRALSVGRPALDEIREEMMARDGYRIFDSDTHVGPDAAILSTLSERRREGPARRLGAIQVAPTATAMSPTPRGSARYRRRLGDAEPRRRRRPATWPGFTGVKRDARAVAAGRCRSRRRASPTWISRASTST